MAYLCVIGIPTGTVVTDTPRNIPHIFISPSDNLFHTLYWIACIYFTVRQYISPHLQHLSTHAFFERRIPEGGRPNKFKMSGTNGTDVSATKKRQNMQIPATYGRMRRMHIPKAAIESKMMRDGYEKDDIEAFFNMDIEMFGIETISEHDAEKYREMRRSRTPRSEIQCIMKRAGYGKDCIQNFFKVPLRNKTGKILEAFSEEAKILRWKWGTTHRHKVNRLFELGKNPKQILRALAGFTVARKKPRKKRRPKKSDPFDDCRPYHHIKSRLISHTIFIALMHEDGRIISSGSLRDGILHWGTTRTGTSEHVATPQELRHVALTLKANDRRLTALSPESRYAFAIVQQRKFTSAEWILSPYIHHTIFSYLVETRVDYMSSNEISRSPPLTFGGHKMMLRNITQDPASIQITAIALPKGSHHAMRSPSVRQEGPVFLFACRVRRFAVCVCKIADDQTSSVHMHGGVALNPGFGPFFEYAHRGGLDWARGG